MTKSEFYKKCIDVHIECGQGIAGIVMMQEPYRQYMNEFIEEKLFICCETGGSLGHPESNRFYMPTKGYNVFLDDIDYGTGELSLSRFKGGSLMFVRIYLDCNFDNPEQKITCLRDPSFMKKYANWLEKNKAELDVMLQLDNFYEEKDIVLSDEILNYLHNTKMYTKNTNVEKFIDEIDKYLNKLHQQIPIYHQLLKLYDDKKDISRCQKELAETEQEILYIRKIKLFADKQDKKVLIQSII